MNYKNYPNWASISWTIKDNKKYWSSKSGTYKPQQVKGAQCVIEIIREEKGVSELTEHDK